MKSETTTTTRDTITRQEAGELLGVHPETIKRMVRRKELTEFVLGRNTVRLSRAEVLSYLAASRRAA